MKGGNHNITGGKPYIGWKKGGNQWGEIQLRENQQSPWHSVHYGKKNLHLHYGFR